MKKKTFEEVRELFESRGYTLLSTEYKCVHSHLEFICDQGHQANISFKHLQNSHGCLECSGKKKKTIEEVRKLFESRKYQLLSTEYSSNKSPLLYICDQGHQAEISFSSLQKINGCAKCVGLKKKTIKEVRELFESRNYTLLSKDYSNSNSPLEYICSKGHQTKISFNKLQSGRGCIECSGKRKKTIEEAKQLFTDRGYTLLTIEYKNAFSLLSYICDRGHQNKISFSSLQTGRGCAECAKKKKKTIEEVKLAFNQRGYTLLSKDYSSNNSPIKYICDQGHQNKISFKHLQRGVGCSSCANHGFNPSKPAILYYLRFQFESDFYYKIGITNNTTSKRFQSEKTPYIVIKETHYLVGKDARDKEQAILKQFVKYKYKGQSFLTVGGNTELFNRDVLQLDDSILKAGRM